MSSGGGMFGVESIEWFNGGLFDSASVLALTSAEITTLVEVGRLDWTWAPGGNAGVVRQGLPPVSATAPAPYPTATRVSGS
ncbi:MAG: hypothetical protein ACREMY_17595 [bacterium]